MASEEEKPSSALNQVQKRTTPDEGEPYPEGFGTWSTTVLNARMQGDEATAEQKMAEKKPLSNNEMFPPTVKAAAITGKEAEELKDSKGWDETLNKIYSGKENLVQGMKPKDGKGYLLNNAIGATLNGNGNAVNPALGIFTNALCGDGFAGYDFKLHELARACDMNFNVIQEYNICSRHTGKDPWNEIISSVRKLEAGLEELIDLPARVINNLIDNVEKMVKKLNLPLGLEECLLTKAVFDLKQINKGSSAGLASMLEKAFNVDVCAMIKDSVASHHKSVKKASTQPIVKSATTFDETTMYSFATAMLDSNVIENDMIGEILVESINPEKPSTNIINTLKFLAYVKVSEINKKKVLQKDINSINRTLHKVPDSAATITANILDANESGAVLKPIKVADLDIPKTIEDIKNLTYVPADKFLKAMKDDLSETNDPIKTLEDLLRLFKVIDPNFDAEAMIIRLYLTIGTGELARRVMSSRNSEVVETSKEESIEEATGYLKVVEDKFDVVDKVGILRSLNLNGHLETF